MLSGYRLKLRNDAFEILKKERDEGQEPETLDGTKLAQKMHKSQLGIITSKKVESAYKDKEVPAPMRKVGCKRGNL